MSKDLIGKYCLVYMTPSRTEFRLEISVITGVSKNFPDSYVILDNDMNSSYHVQGLLVSDDIGKLENLLEVQGEYLEDLNTLRNKIHNLKKDYSVKIGRVIKQIKE